MDAAAFYFHPFPSIFHPVSEKSKLGDFRIIPFASVRFERIINNGRQHGDARQMPMETRTNHKQANVRLDSKTIIPAGHPSIIFVLSFRIQLYNSSRSTAATPRNPSNCPRNRSIDRSMGRTCLSSRSCN